MKTELIYHSDNSRRVILIFAGWSTTPSLYASLEAEGWDIIVVYDYTSLEFPHEILEKYSTIFVLAWSLGVAVADFALSAISAEGRIAAAVAVNGTTHPVSDSCGIPTAIYTGTEQNLTHRNLLKFQKRISSRSDQHLFPIDADFVNQADIEALRLELRNIADINVHNKGIRWSRAYIGLNDAIFPAANQRQAWLNSLNSYVQIIECEDKGHYIPLQKIIREITPDHRRIASRFRNAIDSYDSNAEAQGKIVTHLLKMIDPAIADRPIDILEIGPGSGLLSRQLPLCLNIHSATFVDLYPLNRFGICENEEYVVGDAERWISSQENKKFDLIISSSAMQWFADPRGFMQNASRILKDRGMLLCSTFLPGNLAELDTLRPSPLLYRSQQELHDFTSSCFAKVELSTESIRLRFNSPREALIHLKMTGVGGGSSASTRHLLTALPPRPTLTYLPLYIKAIK